MLNVIQLDYDLVDYVSQLREGILEAYTGVVTGLKNTEKGKSCMLGSSPHMHLTPPDPCSVIATSPHF